MVLEKIIDMVAAQFMVEASQISRETRFVEDLSADSLDVVELALGLEREFSLPEIPEESLKNISTVGDLADYVASTVG